MADPVTMTVMAASTGLKAFGEFEAGQAANKAGKYNRDIAYREAEQLDTQAEQEIAVSTFRAVEIARRAKELQGTQRVAASAGNQAATDTSVTEITQETVRTATLDQLMEMAQAEERAQQIKYQGVVRRSEGDFARYQGKQQQRAATLRAATTIMDGAVSWADKYGGGGGGGSGGGKSGAAIAKALVGMG